MNVCFGGSQSKSNENKNHNYNNMVVRQLLTERLHSLKHKPLYNANENNTLRNPNNLINVIN